MTFIDPGLKVTQTAGLQRINRYYTWIICPQTTIPFEIAALPNPLPK